MPEPDLLFRADDTAPDATSASGARALPANVEAEAAFLGAVLIDNRVIEELTTNLSPAHFFEPVHVRIYERILQLLDRKAVVTPVTLKPYFEADEALKELGGAAYLARLTADGQGLLAPRQLRSDLLILAGRPGMGKTSLVTNIAFNAADRMRRDLADGIEAKASVGAGVAFFSLEMSADQLATRILAEQSGISSEMLRMGKISRDDFQSLSFASQRLAELPLYIDDTPGLSIAALRTRARRLKRRHDIGLVIVDYLQLLQGTNRSGNDNRVNEISEISRGLKTLAKELQVPVIALSQLSRAVEQREDKRPMLSDLRESGSIEQDADMVWFVFREDYYVMSREPKQPVDGDDAKTHEAHAAWQAEMERVYGLAELIVAKQRHGSTGKVRLRFEPRITRFSDLADDALAGDRYDD